MTDGEQQQADEAPVNEDAGEKGLGSESGALGGENSPTPRDEERRKRQSGDTPGHDDTPVDEDGGDKGLGSESGALGGEKSAPHNPDPSTKGATKGTEGAL